MTTPSGNALEALAAACKAFTVATGSAVVAVAIGDADKDGKVDICGAAAARLPFLGVVGEMLPVANLPVDQALAAGRAILPLVVSGGGGAAGSVLVPLLRKLHG